MLAMQLLNVERWGFLPLCMSDVIYRFCKLEDHILKLFGEIIYINLSF